MQGLKCKGVKGEKKEVKNSCNLQRLQVECVGFRSKSCCYIDVDNSSNNVNINLNEIRENKFTSLQNCKFNPNI